MIRKSGLRKNYAIRTTQDAAQQGAISGEKGVSTLVNGGTFASFAIGMGIAFAAGGIANAIGGALAGTAEAWKTFVEGSIIGVALSAALQGSIGGAISSLVYGQNVGKGMLQGMYGGLAGLGVAVATGAVTSFGKSVIEELGTYLKQIEGCGVADPKEVDPQMPQAADLDTFKSIADAWLEDDGRAYGCGLKVTGGNFQNPDFKKYEWMGFYHVQVDNVTGKGYPKDWGVTVDSSKYRTLLSGLGKGTPCSQATCAQIRDCWSAVEKRVDYTIGGARLFYNCHTQTQSVINDCCLKSSWRPSWYSGWNR